MKKTILLQFKRNARTKAQRWTLVGYNGGEGERLFIMRKNEYGSLDNMILDPQPDGSFKNEHGCAYIEVKQDRRPKPFSVIHQEEGRGPRSVEKFATLAELQAYVKARWCGMEYVDGSTSFHTDYCTYELIGCELNDLGSSGTGSEYYNWTWKNLQGNDEAPTKDVANMLEAEEGIDA